MIEQGPPLMMFLQALIPQAMGYFAVVTLLFLSVWKFGEARFRARRIQVTKRFNAEQWRHEVLNTLATLTVGTTTAVGISMLFASGHTKLSLEWPAVPVALAWVLALTLFNDAWFYGWHRLLHHPKLFKYVHAVHHRSVDVNPYSSYSFHVLEAFVLGAWVVPFVVLVPFSIPVLGVLQTIGLANNVMSHLGYEFLPLWFLRVAPFRWMNTATFHNLHHTTVNGNYGLFFRFWDVVFGTEVPDYEKTFRQREATKLERTPQ